MELRFALAEPAVPELETGRKLFAGGAEFLKGVVAMAGLPPGNCSCNHHGSGMASPPRPVPRSSVGRPRPRCMAPSSMSSSVSASPAWCRGGWPSSVRCSS